MKGISNSEVKRHLIICSPHKTSIIKVLRQLRGSDFQWVYLGEDVSRALAIEQQVGDKGQRLAIGSQLQEIAHSLRQPYIDYIGKLSIANNSLSWWVGCLSEKNPWVSKTFLYACYIRLCQTILNSGGQETLVFIGENKTIRKGIFGNLVDLPHYEILRIELPWRDLLSTIRNTGRLAFLKVYLSVLTIYHILLARRYRLKLTANQKLQEGEGLCLLYNWVDPRSFDANGEYRDNYFGGLAHHLRNKGKRVLIVPHILPTVPYRQTLKKLASSNSSFLIPESFLTVSDACRIFIKTILNIPKKRAFPAFEGIDISGIIMNDLIKEWGSNNIASNLLLYEAVKRLKKAGIPIGTFIYPYENQVWEKAYCLALRKFYPSARIIGYQHSTVPKMLLNHFFSKDELPILPFPDKVITNGKYTERLFKESGYDPAKVVRGGAIRFLSLVNREKHTIVRKDSLNPVILVTPSIDKNETIELVWKVLRAFGQMKQYKIVFKFHPDCPYRFIAREIGILPKHFIVSDKPTGELLQESHVLLYTCTATSIEAIALSVPVLHIKSDFTIDRDNLSDFPSSIRESVSTRDEIVKATERLLKMDEKELSRKRLLWAEVVAEMFGPVDESTFDLFL
jgi:surface carbohydrate biosynthesis protein (TIGR04326 family)